MARSTSKSDTTGRSPTYYSPAESLLYLERKYGSIARLKASTLSKWRATGEGPDFVKFGSRVAYSAEALDQFMSQRIRVCSPRAVAA